jgi:hypothetical protein
VLDVCSWPITNRTTLTGTPLVTSHVAYEWRKSWNRNAPTELLAMWTIAY